MGSRSNWIRKQTVTDRPCVYTGLDGCEPIWICYPYPNGITFEGDPVWIRSQKVSCKRVQARREGGRVALCPRASGSNIFLLDNSNFIYTAQVQLGIRNKRATDQSPFYTILAYYSYAEWGIWLFMLICNTFFLLSIKNCVIEHCEAS